MQNKILAVVAIIVFLVGGYAVWAKYGGKKSDTMQPAPYGGVIQSPTPAATSASEGGTMGSKSYSITGTNAASPSPSGMSSGDDVKTLQKDLDNTTVESNFDTLVQ